MFGTAFHRRLVYECIAFAIFVTALRAPVLSSGAVSTARNYGDIQPEPGTAFQLVFNASCGPEAEHGEDLAVVSYYIAQILDPDGKILVPVPCLSRVTVTNVETGNSTDALITWLCINCRNRYISLSPSAFAKLRPGPTSAAGTAVRWQIDI